MKGTEKKGTGMMSVKCNLLNQGRSDGLATGWIHERNRRKNKYVFTTNLATTLMTLLCVDIVDKQTT